MALKSIALSVPQMAQVLGISKPVAYELIKKDGFPSVRISDKRIVIPLRLLEKWLEDQAKVPR